MEVEAVCEGVEEGCGGGWCEGGVRACATGTGGGHTCSTQEMHHAAAAARRGREYSLQRLTQRAEGISSSGDAISTREDTISMKGDGISRRGGGISMRGDGISADGGWRRWVELRGLELSWRERVWRRVKAVSRANARRS
jgi:hypothetical protein